MSEFREELGKKIAGEITLADDPGGTLRKWRTDFEISQSTLAEQLDVSSSVISDYESGRRENPGTATVRRIIEALLDIDESRGGTHIRHHALVTSAGFDSDIVHDLREYTVNVPLADCYAAIDATELTPGDRDTIRGYTVLDSVEAIRRLSSDMFYDLYGQSTDRALVFTNNSEGKGALIALRVVNTKPNAVVLHGMDEDDVWEYAPELARADGISLAVTDIDLDDLLAGLRELG